LGVEVEIRYVDGYELGTRSRHNVVEQTFDGSEVSSWSPDRAIVVNFGASYAATNASFSALLGFSAATTWRYVAVLSHGILDTAMKRMVSVPVSMSGNMPLVSPIHSPCLGSILSRLVRVGVEHTLGRCPWRD